MRQPDNVRQVESLGIDMMGFIFWNGSKRNNDVNPSYLPKECKRVGVFVNAECHYVVEKAKQCGLDFVQLHGGEDREYIEELRSRFADNSMECGVIKALSISSSSDLKRCDSYEGMCDYLLFDTKCESVGGSGRRFDWHILNDYTGSFPFLLSGGISVEHAEEIKNISHPRFVGVDLNSKFEIAPALKDVALLENFINELK